MPEPRPAGRDAVDEMLFELFGDDEAVPDKGFSEGVLKDIRRRERVRAVVIALATVVGGAIAVTQVAGLMTGAADTVVRLLQGTPQLMQPVGFVNLFLGVTAALLAPFAVRALEG